MYMFTSYGHIKNPKWNHRFFYDFSLGHSLKCFLIGLFSQQIYWLGFTKYAGVVSSGLSLQRKNMFRPCPWFDLCIVLFRDRHDLQIRAVISYKWRYRFHRDGVCGQIGFASHRKLTQIIPVPHTREVISALSSSAPCNIVPSDIWISTPRLPLTWSVDGSDDATLWALFTYSWSHRFSCKKCVFFLIWTLYYKIVMKKE